MTLNSLGNGNCRKKDCSEEKMEGKNDSNEIEGQNLQPNLENEEDNEQIKMKGKMDFIHKDSEDAPDGGYGWIIVVAAFFCMLITGGFIKSAGLFFLQFRDRFQTGAMKAAVPGSVLSTLSNILGPLVAMTCNRYSVRTAVMIGTITFFTGALLNMYADSYYFLFVCHSVLQGTGIAFMSQPPPYIISMYFEKRRSFANSLASAGMGAGTFAIVPLVNFLFEFYGFQGTFLLLAAILSNGFVVALLFRPLSLHRLFLKTETKKRKELYGEDDVTTRNDLSNVPLKLDNSAGHNEEFSDLELTTQNDIFHNQDASQRDNNNYNLTAEDKSLNQRSLRFKLKSYWKVCFPTEHSRKVNEKKKIFHFSLLKNVSFLLHAIGVTFFVMCVKGVYTFIPAICLERGLSKSDAALVLSIVGAVDTFGRIGCGFIMDFTKLRPLRPIVFVTFLFGLAGATVFVPSLKSFASFAVVCSIFGSCCGMHASQRPVVLVDMMGKELLPSSMGILRVFISLGMLLGPLIYGGLRDWTGDYSTAFYFGSICALISGVLLALSYAIWAVQNNKEQKRSRPSTV